MIKDADAGERICKNVLMSNCFRVKSGECELICVGWAVGATTCAYGNDRCAFACGTYCGQAYIAKSLQYRFLFHKQLLGKLGKPNGNHFATVHKFIFSTKLRPNHFASFHKNRWFLTVFKTLRSKPESHGSLDDGGPKNFVHVFYTRAIEIWVSSHPLDMTRCFITVTLSK